MNRQHEGERINTYESEVPHRKIIQVPPIWEFPQKYFLIISKHVNNSSTPVEHAHKTEDKEFQIWYMASHYTIITRMM